MGGLLTSTIVRKRDAPMSTPDYTISRPLSVTIRQIHSHVAGRVPRWEEHLDGRKGEHARPRVHRIVVNTFTSSRPEP